MGSQVIKELKKEGPERILVPKHKEIDLRDQKRVLSYFSKTEPDLVIHLAGRVGGIGETRARPAEFFYDNAQMAMNVVEASYRSGVKKFVGIGSVCSYPKFSPIPFKEDDLWEGYPEETNAPYGLAKKMMLVQTQAYTMQYGFKGIHLLMVNLYGPGDELDPKSSHVISGMIYKFLSAKRKKQREVVFWGDGSPTREFLYVEDAARGIVLASKRYSKSDPVNLGSGMEISIKELAVLLKDMTGFEGKIIWDTSKPNGQPRRCLDVSRAQKEFGFKARVSFKEGLRLTIDWYLENISK